MSTPSASSEDRAEQDTPVVREPAADVQVPLEAAGADVAEQSAAAGPPEPQVRPDLPLEADAGDVAEQSAVVALDEDEHR